MIAVAEGGPATLIENNHTGLLCQADADHLAGGDPAPRLHAAAAAPARCRGRQRRPGSLLGAVAGAARGRLRPGGRHLGPGWPASGSSCCLSRPGKPGAPQYDGLIDDPALYFNRELSWLDFNQRVLELAEDQSVPLLERVRFCSIYASNLDEFFMVRVAGLFDQLDAGIDARGPDGLGPGRTDRLDPGAGPRARRPPQPLLQGGPAPRAREGGDPDRLARDGDRGGAPRDRRPLPRPGVPGPDAAGDRARPAVPLYLEPLAQPRRPPARPRERRPRSSPGSRCRRSFSAASCGSARRGKRPSCRSRRRSPPTSMPSSPAPRSSTTATSGSPATPTSPSPTRPTTSSRRSRTNSVAAASARSSGSRSRPG